MDVPVPHLLTLMALRAEETFEILIPLAAPAVSAVLLNPGVRYQLGRAGTVTALTVALLVAATAIYALGRA